MVGLCTDYFEVDVQIDIQGEDRNAYDNNIMCSWRGISIPISMQQLELSRAHTLHAHCINLDLNHIAAPQDRACEYVDDLLPMYYLTCAHEQRAHGLQSIGAAIKNTVFVTLVGLVNRFEA